jgi:hypothetical protein
MIPKVFSLLTATILAPSALGATADRTIHIYPGSCTTQDGVVLMYVDLPDIVVGTDGYGYYAHSAFPSEDDCWRARLQWLDQFPNGLDAVLHETVENTTSSQDYVYECGPGGGNDRPHYCRGTRVIDLVSYSGTFTVDDHQFSAETSVPRPD